MKPIEIHIEGYKIVISKDDSSKESAEKKEDTATVPLQPPYTPYAVWNVDANWKAPDVTLTSSEPKPESYVIGGR
ncbi:MAG: hypothetical protein J6W04_00150 [Bacteroidales bacterium]|nr:hypothetical protein [Bacteroidales bacterium]